MPGSHRRTPSPTDYLRARAALARKLLRDGEIEHPLDALAVAVWPTRAILEAEQAVAPNTIAWRAFNLSRNP